jgi:ribosomal protein S18 acetylase RimI-like enzyme
MQPDHALPHEIEPALHLLLGHLDAHERQSRIARVVELIEQGNLDVRGIFVLRGGAGNLAGVIVCEPIAGAGAILWPPVLAGGPRIDLENLLIHHACDWLRSTGARLAQCLLPPDEAPLAGSLLRNGFNQVTSLSYLCHDRFLCEETIADPKPLCFEPYDPAHPALFHETLVRSYQHTLDCPEVNGVRTIEEVIAGHQAQAGGDTSRWWLVRRAGEVGEDPLGVVLMHVVRPGEEGEVAYMGVVPEARRQGFGRAMLHKALDAARLSGIPRLTLCVDDRNLPAWRLYQRAGFVPFDQRLVFLAVWRRAYRRLRQVRPFCRSMDDGFSSGAGGMLARGRIGGKNIISE